MTQVSLEQAMQAALQHHQAGRLGEAERIYRQILAQQPNDAQALYYLGLIAHQVGRHAAAVDLVRRSIALWPDNAEAHYNLGIVLFENGLLAEAIAAYRQAIALNPNNAEAHTNLGVALLDNGQSDEAIASFRRAIAINPGLAKTWYDLGNALQADGQMDEAIAAFGRAIAINPDVADVHCNLGNVLNARGQSEEAVSAYRRCIVLNPDHAQAYSNLGGALRDKGEIEHAIVAFRRAIALKPEFAEAHNNLGIALKEKGDTDAAIAAFGRAIAINPSYSDAHGNLGVALKDRGQLDDAIASFRQAIALNPSSPDAHSNLVYTIHFHPGYDAKAIAEEHRHWNREYGEPLKKFIRHRVNDRPSDRRIRIGYVSPDFREHPVGRLIFPLLANHDKSKFEIFAYSQVLLPDALTQRFLASTDGWRNILGLSDAKVAELIRQDQIDILVDLTMHMADNRLLVFARKPAPVQVTYLAYCSTTGLETIDYRLSDPYLDPPNGDDSVYSEQTIRLPDSYWCYQPSTTALPDVGPLPVVQQGNITFGCLNNFCKVSEPVLDTWAQLLLAVPNSRLLLHARQGSHRRRVQERLERSGVDSKRVEFVGFMPAGNYLELYRRIDIALDTFPYAGGTTTCDALWMGVPVISLAGKTAVGRGGVSILSNIGLPELVAHSQKDYVRLATELAGDVPRLIDLRSTLRHCMEQSPLTDVRRFSRNVESAYRQMWQRWSATAPVE